MAFSSGTVVTWRVIISALLALAPLQLRAFVDAYASGPPVYDHPDICESMFPTGHRGAVGQISAPPYHIVYNTLDCYSTPSQPVLVTVYLEDPSNYFQGIFIQARVVGGLNESWGVFGSNGDPVLSPLSCDGRINNTLGQNAKAHYTEKTMTWSPPAAFKDDIYFVATLVRSTTTFWLDLRSSVLSYSASCTIAETTTVHSAPTTTIPGQSTSTATIPGQSTSTATIPGQSPSTATIPGQSSSSTTVNLSETTSLAGMPNETSTRRSSDVSADTGEKTAVPSNVVMVTIAMAATFLVFND